MVRNKYRGFRHAHRQGDLAQRSPAAANRNDRVCGAHDKAIAQLAQSSRQRNRQVLVTL
jgi:hypothetical protein